MSDDRQAAQSVCDAGTRETKYEVGRTISVKYHCATHGKWDALVASGCPECVRQLRNDLAASLERIRVWAEQFEIFAADYREYVDGKAGMPFGVLRASLGAFMESSAALTKEQS